MTHSVLLTSVAAATLWVFIRLLKTGARRYYVGFGLCIGLGMLSKYNYAIVLLPMVLAALSTARFRSRIGSSRIFLSGLAFAAVFGPHLQAALTLPEATLGRVDQLHLGQAVSHLEAGIRGVGSLLEGFVAHTVVLALVYVLLFLRAPHVVSDSAETPRRGDFETLLRRTLVFGLLAVAGVLVLFKIPSITTRPDSSI